MGASSSKPIKTAANAAVRRQYPKSPSSSTTAPSGNPPADRAARAAARQEPPGPVLHSKQNPSAIKSEENKTAIDLDARDPHFAASLRSIGPVTPNPFNQQQPQRNNQKSLSTVFPPSTTSPKSRNPSLLVFSSRAELEKLAAREFESVGRQSHTGREFLDVVSIRHVLAMRDKQGMSEEIIEKKLRLKKGAVALLGRKGIVGLVR
ncbi:conserved hypothetical protein [Histoplasma capsulatum G186AR]|uniref:Helix-turn-helix domain-containing protein n=1 Tax=Ajellomyces capsulatus (strain G186AR / H82 / ATCC MYA-2454 / RMSCC 2432) TaxID=447093 RepID=C0NMG8_AJECG|nr:uncharacterized protein HCBG_03945 [Histoplasma capsulatum G186AR]EEH07066.1 conserved hypothetical protein [Histoplasma capsulatum G186AR]